MRPQSKDGGGDRGGSPPSLPEHKVKLTKGYHALVDPEDIERVSQLTWHAREDKTTVYAQRAAPRNSTGPTTILMHRFILGLTDPKSQVDHINHNGLDNRKCNLRVVTQSENNANRRKHAKAHSAYKGVTFSKKYQRWQASLKVSSVLHFIGYFMAERDAARAYNKVAFEWYGEHAHLNEVPDG